MENNLINTSASSQTQNREVFKVKNERMGGFVPSWDAPKASHEHQNYKSPIHSYAPQLEQDNLTNVRMGVEDQKNEFSFWDLVDMVNPLQHIPVVNFAYRELSGDEIRPISQIIGGGIFGGPAGLASGLVNVLIKEETGKDVMGNAISFVGLDSKQRHDELEYIIDDELVAYEDLPVALLSFAQVPISSLNVEVEKSPSISNDYERVQIASGRSAGTIAVYS